MYTNDLIADTITRIRNAIMRDRETVVTPASNVVKQILEILKKENFINGYNEVTEGVVKQFEVELRYVNGEAAIRELKRISKPGIRRYVGYRDIKKVKNGQGIAIVTTPKGIMTAEQARKQKIGGEILCEIW